MSRAPVRINRLGLRAHVVPFGTPLPPPPPPPPPPPSPDAWLIMGNPRPYFVAPANVPGGTTRLTFRGEFRLPALPPATSPNFAVFFTQESSGCDLSVDTDGGMSITVEDATGARVINGVQVRPAGFFQINTDYQIIFDVNHATQTATVTINGTAYVVNFSAPGTGVFQSNREVSLLAGTAGQTVLPIGTRVRNLSVDYNGTLHKSISNTASEANADSWKQGGAFTNA